MDRQARIRFRDDIGDVHWNRERLHPYKRRSQEQVAVHKTEVIGDTLIGWATARAEARGNFNQRLRPLERFEDQAAQQVDATLQRLDLGLPVPAGRVDAWERARKHFSDRIDKINKQKEDAIARELKVAMALYCQKHGLARAEKIAKRQYRRLVWALGVEKANEAMSKLFSDILKAVVEGKLGIGAY